MNKKQLSSIIIFCVIAIIIISLFILRKVDYSYLATECDEKAADILAEYNVAAKNSINVKNTLVSAFRKKAQSIEREYLIDLDQSIEEIKEAFSYTDNFLPAELGRIQKKITKEESILTLDFFYKDLRIYTLILRQKIALANIALVIDDWGYSDKVLQKSFDLGIPLTYAILPNLAVSKKVAKYANKKGHDVILHLPLEPHNAHKHPLEKNTILTSMTKEEIEKILKNNIKSVPYIKGINNHMGSKATEHKHVMGTIFDVLKKDNMFFLDSYTSNDSIAENIAKEKGIVFLKREVFIDNKADSEHIKEQLLKAKNIASKQGSVIAIGHAKDITIDTIKEIIPEFKKQGFKFLTLSDLIKDDLLR